MKSVLTSSWFRALIATAILVLQVVLIVFFYTTDTNREMPMKPAWGAWETGIDCTVSCGPGKSLSVRTCFGDTKEKSCKGDAVRTEECQAKPCDVNGGWSEWKIKNSCSVTCGQGQQEQERTCTNPSPSGQGIMCQGDRSRSVECILPACLNSVDGGWSEWSVVSGCSKTCGANATQVEIRTCTNPMPQDGGQNCSGDHVRTSDCNLPECLTPVDGGWSSWTVTAPCSSSCGNGTEIRKRTCNNPEPANGGANCTGEAIETIGCTQDFCTGWNEWTNATGCSVTCGTGTIQQERTCIVDPPTNCSGPSAQQLSCSLDPCPVNGGWSNWTETSACTVTCGGGEVLAERMCTNPEPQHGGMNCTGNNTDIIACNTQECLDVTELTILVNATDVCATIASEDIPKYACAFPFIYEGEERSECVQISEETKCPAQVYLPSRAPVEDKWYKCDTSICPVAGGWSDWASIALCSSSCGGGTISQERYCRNPLPKNGGSECLGESQRIGSCNERPCPSEMCMTVAGGPFHDTPCILPFLKDNVIHNDCIYGEETRPWCATWSLQDDGSLMPNEWGYCHSNCPVEGTWEYSPSNWYLCPCGHPNFILMQTQRCHLALNGGSCLGEPETRAITCFSTECVYTDCGGALNGSQGTFSSPNFPDPYPQWSWCEWTITVPSGRRIMLTFTSRDTEQDHDIISLWPTELGTIVELSGVQTSPEAFLSLKEIMVVRFESDVHTAGQGFRAEFSAV